MMDHTGNPTSDHADIPDDEPQQMRRMISALRDELVYSRAAAMQILAEKAVLERVVIEQSAETEKYAELNAAKRDLILKMYRAERTLKAEVLALKYMLNLRDGEIQSAMAWIDTLRQENDHLKRTAGQDNQPIRAVEDRDGVAAWSMPGSLPRGIR